MAGFKRWICKRNLTGNELPQVVVALLEPLQSSSLVAAAATAALGSLVEGALGRGQGACLHGLPPLPRLQGLEAVNAALAAERGGVPDAAEHVRLLLAPLASHSAAVRETALQACSCLSRG